MMVIYFIILSIIHGHICMLSINKLIFLIIQILNFECGDKVIVVLLRDVFVMII